tara:strand:- start:26 stop:847 length:822 start_codon:yes stop_codon:yes gene_type:complete
MLKECPASYNYYIDDNEIVRTLSGNLTFDSPPKSLLSQDLNLLEGLSANNNGFLVCDFLNIMTIEKIITALFKFLSEKFEDHINKENLNDFFINMNDEIFHKKMKDIYLGIPFSRLPLSVDFFEDWASKILKKKVKLFCITKEPSLLIRIVRPFANDFNPPHKDIYIESLRNGINCFMPILGVNQNSSLPIIPKSHKWLESETERTELNPLVDGLKFSVAAMISKKDLTPLKLTRPKVNYGQVMLFSPYCIHGGGKNLSKDTRISFEFRFKIK